MVVHYPAKLGDHRHCGSGDMNILANTLILPQMRDIRDCICWLTSTIIIFSKSHGMSCATRIPNNK